MSNLSNFQENLVNELIAEFKRINPIVTNDNNKRFTLSTISDCANEEQKFLDSIKKHNLLMLKIFDKQYKEEIKNVTKEFGKVFEIKTGYGHGEGNPLYNTYEGLIDTVKVKPLHTCGSKEVHLFIVSKTKKYSGGDSRYDHCNGKAYATLYVDFKREPIAITLESGKVVRAVKIVGLTFSNCNYLNRDSSSAVNTNTLDAFIQTSKQLQAKLVELAT